MRGCAFDRKVISVFDETFDPLYGADLPGVCLDALGGAIACIRHAHAGARGECPCGCRWAAYRAVYGYALWF